MSITLLYQTIDFARNLRDFSLFLEDTLLIILIIRILYFLKKGCRFRDDSIEIVYYILIYTIAVVITKFFTQNQISFNFTHAFTPLMFIFTLIKLNIDKKLSVLFYIIIATFNLFYLNNLFIELTYFISIFLLINKSINLAKKSQKYMTDSAFYLFLTLDQILTFYIFLMGNLNYDWHSSHLIIYYNMVINIIFPSTLIYINVKFRRLILN